jgi:TolB protein
MTLRITRRSSLAILGGAAALPLLGTAGRAQDLTIHGGQFKPIAVAITGFLGESEVGAKLSAIITNNFNRSVFLVPADPHSFPEHVDNPDQPPHFDLWKSTQAQFIVTGRIGRSADGRLQADFRLWDVNSGEQVAGQEYVTDPNNSRRIAHLISDAVFSRVTGEKGCFDSRVVFIDETGPAVKRRKRLAIMDQDGANVRYLTRGDDLVVTPRFSPTSQDVTYMSFGLAEPKVYLLNIESGQREVVGNFPGMTFSPRFSPDGSRIVMSLSQGANANLYSMDLRSRTTTRLTDTEAIDTSPSYSPDGSQIVFESDRGGSQQIYIMPAEGGAANRISFGAGARYATPVWSPKGDLIAFTLEKGNSFGIGVMRPDGTGERILTEGFHNEGPTWAPNGLFLMFFRDPGGEAGAKIFMTDVFGRAEFPVQTPSYASDPAWGPLLS